MKQKSVLLVIGLVIVASVACLLVVYRSKTAGIVDNSTDASVALTVTMQDNKYNQTAISIKKGDTIRFVNGAKIGSGDDYWPASNIHPSHQIYPEFDPQGPLHPGESWSFKFDKVGHWRFHDHLHYPDITGYIDVTR